MHTAGPAHLPAAGTVRPRGVAEIMAVAKGAVRVTDIPSQLRGCRFIRVAGGGKAAVDQGWQSLSNYAADAGIFQQWLESGGNYGILLADDICCLDADNPAKLESLFPVLGNTFTVRTGRGGMGGLHVYFRSPGWPPEKIGLVDPETGEAVGDLRGPGSPFYTVGPGCLHPSGKRYEVVKDAPLTVTDKEVLEKAIAPFRQDWTTSSATVQESHRRGGRLLSDVLGLSVEDFLPPDNARVQGEEVVGGHPVHGSETGQNFHVNRRQGVWHCFRCGSGGGPLEAMAVSEGIIRCDEARPGCLEGHWREIFDALRRLGYGEKMQAAGIDTPKKPQPTAREPENKEQNNDLMEKAKEILESGDPIDFIREEFKKIHIGDEVIFYGLVASIGCQLCTNTEGIQPGLTGESGKGKTDSCRGLYHLLPDRYKRKGSFSDTALFYDPDLMPGMVIFFDDAGNMDDFLKDVIKQTTSQYQERFERNVTVKFNIRKQSLPPRICYWITSVSGAYEDQFLNRQLNLSIDDSANQDAEVMAAILKAATTGRYRFEITENVLVCRLIFEILKDRAPVCVVIPYGEKFDWKNPQNRRNLPMFLDTIRAFAAIRQDQREVDDDGKIIASIQDFTDAKKIWSARAHEQVGKLTRDQERVLRATKEFGETGSTGVYEIDRPDLQKAIGWHSGKLSRAIEGVKGAGGLTDKVPGFWVTDEMKVIDLRGGDKRSIKYQRIHYDGTLDIFEHFSEIVTLQE